MGSIFNMDSIFNIGLASGGVVVLLVAALIRRLRKQLKAPSPCCVQTETPKEKPGFSLRKAFYKLLSAIDYLRTRREWRYKTPWVLLLGEAGSGKTSLAASASKELRHTAPVRRDELKAEGADWQFFDQGVLIDPDGKLSSAPAGSAEAKRWERALRELESLRPERALDGLLLTVSARTLLHAPTEQRQALAENAYRQLNDIQQHMEFVLPVYVVVTECDTIDGFSAFWEAQPPARRKEMFGWSAPSHASGASANDWANSTFDALAEQLKTLQLDAAAARDNIADADRFFLFPRHFQQLRAPVTSWLNVVFQSSAWQAGFLCRGVYFTGSIAANGARTEGVRKDIAFVDDLISRKVLAERHLAHPTRQGIWSRNSLIKGLQIAGIAAFCGLALALTVAGVQLNRQVDALIASLNLLQEIKASPASGETCIGQDQVYQLLTQVSRIDANSAYWAIPISWIDARANRKSARLIADATFERVIFPSLACHLELRARQLAAYAPKAIGDNVNAYTQSQQTLFDFLQSVEALELNMARFKQLAAYAPQSEADMLMRTFAALAEYAYNSPLPKAVAHEHGALSRALTVVKYDSELHLPAQMRERFAHQLTPFASTLRTELGREIGIGGALLAQLQKEQEPILANTRHFAQWLAWVRKSWLGSTQKDNPCETIRADLQAGTERLIQQYGYPATLEKLASQFSAAQCYTPSMRTLTALQLAPYGNLFTAQDGTLDLNPALAPELSGMSALVALNFMQVSDTQSFSCQAGMTGWRAVLIGQANNYAREYEDFARKQGLPAQGVSADKRPLYDRLAQRQLERVLNSTLRDAQQSADTSAIRQAGLQASSQADQQLVQESGDFSKSVTPLLGLLRLYTQYGFSQSSTKITECVRAFAADKLGQIDTLASMSRLYDPSGNTDDSMFFDFGNTPVTNDYLARQISRSQVLAGYASPFVTFLQNTEAVNDAQRGNEQAAPYWSNTISELNRYVQFKETAGQVAQLHSLFLKQFANLDTANCGKALADYQPPAYGNDLFSQRRQHLEEKVQRRCTHGRKAQAYEMYDELAARFNRELAGRYPFADNNARDASPAAVKTFFTDYAAQRTALRQVLTGLTDNRWNAARRFLDQLDAISAFFASSLTSSDPNQPVKLGITFRAQPGASPGSEQVVSWTLSAGTKSTGYPNRPNMLDWQYGQPLVLDLTWADRSLWRPVVDPKQADLQVDGALASFAASGEWALLRMMDTHRPKSASAVNPPDPNRVLLEFAVPVASTQPGKTATGSARLYLAFNLTGKDAKTQAPVVMTPPASFPRFAPQ